MTVDPDNRNQTLDLRQSFVVDGPAGSGKSDIAFGRFVAALAAVQEPEEVVLLLPDEAAVAAARTRLIGLLRDRPASPLGKRDADNDWSLAERPWRLRIFTPITLAREVVLAAPVSSGCGAAAKLTDDPEAYYSSAVRGLLRSLDHDKAVAPNLETLLLHLDNDLVRAERLLGALLRRRAELRLCLDFERPQDSRARLQSGLEDAVVMLLAELSAVIPDDVADELGVLADFAAGQLAREGSESAIVSCRELRGLPPAEIGHQQVWQGLAELLLDDAGGLRSEADERCGFAVGVDKRDNSAEMHRRMAILLARLQELPGLTERLRAVRTLSDVRYTHRQWTLLQALLAVLPGAFRGLAGAFRALGEMDPAEIVEGAVAALRSGQPQLFGTDGVSHLIVEDTHELSFPGMALVEGLTRDWHDGDGRSLLLTGDAFASIRRSEGAQPALYLKALNNGLERCTLTPVTLHSQSRRGDAIVDWMNRLFVAAAEPVISEGEMPFRPGRSAGDESGEVVLHAVSGGPRVEGEAVARLFGERPDLLSGRVAVLLGDDTAAAAMLDALRDAGIRCVADGVEPLGRRGVVRDLHALTRAVCHLADRVAWLSVLRAPWCGLTLDDLQRLTKGCGDACIWELIGDAQRQSRLSKDGQRRLGRIRQSLEPFVARRGLGGLARTVTGAWTALGGEACLRNAVERMQARDFMQLLDRLDDGGEPDSLERLDNAVAAMRGMTASEADGSLLVTTIRRARRRLFDTVVLAGVSDDIPPPEADDAMRWLVRPDQFGAPQLLLAPLGTGDDDSAIGRWVEELRTRRHVHELRRLLYVGSSRAVRHLHLIARVPERDGRWLAPPAHSPLATVWDRLANDLPAPSPRTGADIPAAQQSGALRRLPSAWQPPTPSRPEYPTDNGPQRPAEDAVVRHDDNVARVLRRVFHEIAARGPLDWAMRSLDTLEETLQHRLSMLGTAPRDTHRLAETAADAVRRALDDERARWFLDPGQQKFAAPLRLSGTVDGRLIDADIDISFVTEGIRWIIGLEFPAPTATTSKMDARLTDLQTLWRDRAVLARRYDPASVRVGWYCPHDSQWREWDPPPDPETA